MSLSTLLPLLVVGPMLVAGVLIGWRGSRATQQGAMVLTLAATLAGSATLLATVADGGTVGHRLGGWADPLAVPFVVDAFSALMLTLTALLTLVVVAFALSTRAADEPYFCPLVLVVTSGVNGAVMTADLFNLFVFIEIMLLPSYGLLMLAHRGEGKRMQVTATRIYATVNLTTSSLFLVGVALVYAGLGTVNLAGVAGRGAESPTALAGSLLLLTSLAVKAAVVPGHGWLGRTYPLMSPTMTALFSGLHTKVAVYAIYRLYAVLFDTNEHGWVAVTLVTVSMVVGVLAALGAQDARTVLSFHMVSQIGYILLGLAIFTEASVAAGVFYLTYHSITKASLFLSVGAVEHGYGRHPIGEVRGLLAREPVTALVFLAAALSLAGLPPFAGFVAKLTLIGAAFSAQEWVAAVVALLVSLFTLMSMLKIWGGTFLGEPDPPMQEHEGSRIGLRLVAPALVLAALGLVLGVVAQPLLHLTGVVAAALVDPAPYLAGVSG
jgi:multicomponent Na+:H+ antiporter subunit D